MRPSGPASAPHWRCWPTRGAAGRRRAAPQQLEPGSRAVDGAFARGLERAFPFPADWAAQAPDELVICRCEDITAGAAARSARSDTGADEMNRLKALTRVGMGRCQGRMCGAAAAEILAHASGRPLAEVGRLRGQAPIKPLPFALLRCRVSRGARR